MNQQLPPPWMLGATQIDDIPMLVVHMGNGELEGLDNLQGGPSVDEETGIREYSALSEIIELPQIRELFQKVSSQLKHHGHVSDDVHKAYETAKDYSLPYRETDEEKHNPLRSLERKGKGSDSKLAYIPANLAAFLIELGHHASINPHTGLLEFGFFKELLRVVGTVGGAILGGPVGAGIGNALASVATGKSVQDSVVTGLKTGTFAYGAQGLGQAAGLGAGTPFTAGFFGGAPNMVASGLGSMGIGAAKTPAVAAASTASKALTPAQELINSAFTPATSSSSMLENLASLAQYAAPLAMAGLSYIGEKKDQKHMQRERERQLEKWDRERREVSDSNWTPVTSKKYEPNPEFWDISEEDIRHGRIHAPYMREVGKSGRYATGGSVQSYREGTLVRGKGKGQADKIKTSVPNNTYIWDASTVSMLGDGSSEAGAEVIKDFENHVKNKVPKKLLTSVEKVVKKHSEQIPVWLSDSEYKTDPVTVSLIPYALGKKEVSNKKGADILRATIKKIRKHKSISGSGLPPKAKPLLQYMSAIR